jgi:hypothetical protein
MQPSQGTPTSVFGRTALHIRWAYGKKSRYRAKPACGCLGPPLPVLARRCANGELSIRPLLWMLDGG